LHRFTRSTTPRRFTLGSGHWLSSLGCPLSARGTRQPETIFLSIPATLFRYGKKKGLLAGAAQVRVVKGIFPIAASLTLMVAVTAVLWHLKLTTGGSKLVYIYLFPVALIAALYSGRLAVLCTAIALVSADYFLQEPLYSFANDNPLEYGDLICFALLAVTAIKFIRELVRPRTRNFETGSRYGW
jgi:K+-sensing histidine kinase KdpD